MPLSVLLELEHHFPLPRQHYGRQFQGWFLDTLRAVDPKLADRFHSNHHETDYTVSSAFIHQGYDEANPRILQHSLLRFTILDDSVRDFFIHQYLPKVGHHIQILLME